MNNLELEKMANEIRKDIVTAVHSAKSGHPGGSLSSADIFTYLYFEEMNVDPANPKWEDRDRFVLSIIVEIVVGIKARPIIAAEIIVIILIIIKFLWIHNKIPFYKVDFIVSLHL